MDGLTLVEAGNDLIEAVLTAATRVHQELGPGLLESAYETALAFELQDRGIGFRRQLDIPVRYRGQELGVGFRADMVVEDCLLLELKAVDHVADIHTAQVITYLKLLGIKRGYLLNFNQRLLKHGIRRISI
jgi:GxxExxY protein